MARNAAVFKRYAAALFDVLEPKQREEALVELSAFRNALRSDANSAKFFSSPVVTRSEKREAITDLKAKLSLTFQFLLVLVDEDRIDSFEGIVDAFEELKQKASGELSVDIESAEPLTDAALEDVRSMLQEKWQHKLKFKTKTNNPELIGGFIAKAPGRVFDASLASQLEVLTEQVLAQ